MTGLRARLRQNGNEAGAGTLEYLGIILFAGLLVAGLVMSATPIGNQLAAKLCEAFGTSCGADAGGGDAEQKEPPKRACEQQASTVEGGFSGGILYVNGDRSRAVTTTEMSDGTFTVEVVDDGGLGASYSPAGSANVEIAIGETFDIGLGYNASVGGNLVAGNGEEYHFDSREDAEDFVAYIGRKTVADGFSMATSHDPIFGPVFDWGGKGVNWVINKFKGYDPPDSSDVSYYYGGVEGYGSANGNALIAGGSGEISQETVLGMKVDHNSGETTAYIDISGSAEGEAHLGWSSRNANTGAGGHFNGEIGVVLETTVDSDGKLTNISVIESGGLEYGENVRENLGITDEATQEGNGHRVQVDVPVTDANREEMLDVIATVTQPGSPIDKAERMAEAAESFHNHVEQNGDITYEQLNTDSSNIFSMALSGKIPVLGVGANFGIDSSRSESEVVDAKYLTPDGWETWDACLD
ncbi:MAG TPA: hypothetical protein VK096_06415 [Actinomycetales bacterium]|nr:hypothetical protein [Actinomycetales bacterium]